MLVSRFGANFPKYYLRAPKCREESLIKHVLGPANEIVPITKCFRLDCRFQDLNPEAWAGSTLGTTYYEETGTIRARLSTTPIRMVMRGGTAHCTASLTTRFHGQFVLKAAVPRVYHPLVHFPFQTTFGFYTATHFPSGYTFSSVKDAIDRVAAPASSGWRAFSESIFLSMPSLHTLTNVQSNHSAKLAVK